MLAIKFKIPNEYDFILSKIFNNIELDNCLWKIAEEETLSYNSDTFFDKDLYTSSEFKEKIDSKEQYIIFLNIQLYKKNCNIGEIKTYEDFLKSDCELILFVTDNTFVQIYSKNDNLLKGIEKNVLLNDFKDVEYIKNDKFKKIFSAYTD